MANRRHGVKEETRLLLAILLLGLGTSAVAAIISLALTVVATGPGTPTPTATPTLTLTPTASASPGLPSTHTSTPTAPTATPTPTPFLPPGACPNVPPDASGPIVCVGTGVAQPGDEVTVDINVLNIGGAGLSTWTLDVGYDPSVVSALSCVSLVSLCNEAFSNDVIRVVSTIPTALLGDSVLAAVTFRCGDDEGESLLTVEIEELFDPTIGEPQPIDAQAVAGSIVCSRDAPTATPTATPSPSPTSDGGIATATRPSPTPTNTLSVPTPTETAPP